MLHIGKYIGYIFHGAGKILFYPHQAKKYIKDKDSYPLSERYAFVNKKAGEVMNKVLKAKLEVKGLERIKDNETYLFAPNHQGILDPICLLHILKKPIIIVSKKEIRDYPVAGKIDYMIDAIFLDRESPRDALKMVHLCNEHLKKETSVLIFPEGTRSKDEEVTIHTYKPGAFKCAYGTEAKIVPVVIDGSYLFLTTKKKNKEKVLKVHFLKPILPSEYENLSTNELAALVESRAKTELAIMRNKDND